MRKCKLLYSPKFLPAISLKIVLAQFVFAHLGPIQIYETDNPYYIEYYAKPNQAIAIQEKVDKIMPIIEHSSSQAVLYQLFVHGLYVNSAVPFSQEQLETNPLQLTLDLA